MALTFVDTLEPRLILEQDRVGLLSRPAPRARHPGLRKTPCFHRVPNKQEQTQAEQTHESMADEEATTEGQTVEPGQDPPAAASSALTLLRNKHGRPRGRSPTLRPLLSSTTTSKEVHLHLQPISTQPTSDLRHEQCGLC